MTISTRKPVQEFTFLTVDDMPKAPTVPFYDALNKALDETGFEDFVE